MTQQSTPTPAAPAPQVVVIDNRGKSFTGSRPGLDMGDIATFFLFGGASLANLVYVYWLSKYIWAWKLIGFMPRVGAGPKEDGTTLVWFCWIMIAVFFFSALNAMTTNYQRTLLAWGQTLSGGAVFVAGLFAVFHYYGIGGLSITATQVSIVWLTLALGVVCTMMGGVATRQVRRYIGSDIPGMHG